MTALSGMHGAPVSRRTLIAVGVVAAAALAATVSGVVQLPDLDKALTDLSEKLGAWTYVLVAALAFLETGAFVGLIAPGETAVILGGVVAAKGHAELPVMLLVAWAAAAGGDITSFFLGRRLGRPFLVARGPRLGVTEPRLERVESFFDRHGPKAVLGGRFVGLVRAVAPFLAGASRMRPRAFLPWSLLGTAAWSATFVIVGYAFSDSFGKASDAITHGALAAAVLATAVLLVRARRQATVTATAAA
jgi:membrane protein DedA with SNARE-associated domain